METNTPINRQEEIDLLEIFVNLYHKRKLIAWCAAGFTFIGFCYAVFFTTPLYHAEGIITPKDAQKNSGSSAFLTQFGGFGTIVASQIGTGNTNLDRLEIIIHGREVAENVITKNNLLPVLFPKAWDSRKNAWKSEDSSKHPSLRNGVDVLIDKYLVVSVNSKINTINIGINSPSPRQAENICNYYLAALNDKVRNDVVQDANRNLIYLDSLSKIAPDPLVVEKIRNMMAAEIERMMLVSSNSFDVLEKPILPLARSKPNKKLIIFSFFMLGLLLPIPFTLVLEYINRVRKRLGYPAGSR